MLIYKLYSTHNIHYKDPFKSKVTGHFCKATMLLLHTLQKYHFKERCAFYQYLSPHTINEPSSNRHYCCSHLTFVHLPCYYRELQMWHDVCITFHIHQVTDSKLKIREHTDMMISKTYPFPFQKNN